jgi:hypothetical protein
MNSVRASPRRRMPTVFIILVVLLAVFQPPATGELTRFHTRFSVLTRALWWLMPTKIQVLVKQRLASYLSIESERRIGDFAVLGTLARGTMNQNFHLSVRPGWPSLSALSWSGGGMGTTRKKLKVSASRQVKRPLGSRGVPLPPEAV